MKLAWIKYDKESNFEKLEELGFNIVKLHNLEELDNTDQKIDELIRKDYNTIVITNQVAGYSENMIDKYSKMEDIRIIIV